MRIDYTTVFEVSDVVIKRERYNGTEWLVILCDGERAMVIYAKADQSLPSIKLEGVELT